MALFTMVLVSPIGTIRAKADPVDSVELNYDPNNLLDDDDTDDTDESEKENEVETNDIDDGDDNKTEMKKDGNQVVLSSNNFQIEVNAKGQVPFYHFNTTIDDVRFFLKFQNMIQFEDGNDNGLYDKGENIGDKLQLTSVKWELDITIDEETEKEFIFRSSEIKQDGYEETIIELINHYTADAAAVKFDINITNWPFEEEATGLCLEFELNWSRGENEGEGMKLKKETDETSISLKNDDGTLLAYFESVSDVEIDGETISGGAHLNDTASEMASKVNIFISYPTFNDTLFHDPEIGTSNDAIILPANLSTITSWLKENVKDGFLAITMITTLILGAFVVLGRRYKS